MSAGWEDLVARVAGASTHLLGRTRLASLAQSKDLGRLAADLEAAYGTSFQAHPGMSPEDMELGVRRIGAEHFRMLARWSAGRATALLPVFLDEDRRNVRALLRGAASGTSYAERLTTLVPTPALPVRALQELARQESMLGVAGLLVAWGHPFGNATLALANEAPPDLLRIDAALNSTYVEKAADAIRRVSRADATRRTLMDFVADTADAENASTALQLAGKPSTVDRSALFVEHGERLHLDRFLEIAATANVTTARSLLARVFRGSRLAQAFQHVPLPFDDAVLATRLQVARQRALRAPLGAAPVLAFVLRIRAELRDLSLIIWRLAAGAPPLPPVMLVTLR